MERTIAKLKRNGYVQQQTTEVSKYSLQEEEVMDRE